MMTNTINAFHELWNYDEAERSAAMGQIEDPKPAPMTNEEMLDDLISIFGMEAPVVINFAHMMDRSTLKQNTLLYTIIIENLELYF